MTAPVLRLLPSPFKLMEAERAKGRDPLARKAKKPKKAPPPPPTEKEVAAKREAAWSTFVERVTELDRADPDSPEFIELLKHKLDQGLERTPFQIGLSMWLRVQRAYHVLHDAWVTPLPKKKTEDEEDDDDEQDPKSRAILATKYRDERGLFRNRFWGFLEADGKRHGAPVPAIRRVMKVYSTLRNSWHKKTPSYAKYKSVENKRRNKLPHVVAKKAAWAASPEGQAWKANHLASAKKMRAQAKAAKRAQREALSNV